MIIGAPELDYDATLQSVVIARSNYQDKKNKENNPRLDIVYSDEHLLEYTLNIYGVLLTR